MPTALALDSRMNVSLFQAGGTANFDITRAKDGTGTVKGIRVFKAGTFRDSMAIQHTWTREHLQQMVFHFDLLRGQGILPNVPWRVDHSISVRNVVGYFEKLYEQDGFLLADVLFTEPEALDKMERGTYRARSAEVGVYETNDEAFYWPVLTGCAFVDLPAVEGLYSKATPVPSTVLYEKENNSMAFQINGKEVTEAEWLKAANYAKALADLKAVPEDEMTKLKTERDDAVQAAQAATAHSKGQPATFMLNGKPTSDVVAVQHQITMLETFRTEAVKAAKDEFVKQLVAGNKLAAPQMQSQQEFVQNLTDEQFDQYKKSWENAPASSLFGTHGTTPLEGAGTGNGAGTKEPSDIETLEEIVAQFKRAGLKEDVIAKTDSFKRLTALRAAAK